MRHRIGSRGKAATLLLVGVGALVVAAALWVLLAEDDAAGGGATVARDGAAEVTETY